MLAGVGMVEIAVILAILFFLFWAPKQLPKLGRNLGEGIREFKNIGKEFREAKNDVKKTATEITREAESAVKEATR